MPLILHEDLFAKQAASPNATASAPTIISFFSPDILKNFILHFGVAEGRHSITEQQASGALRRSLLDFKRKASELPPVPACACPRGSSTWFNFVSSVQGFVFSVPRTFLLAGNRREGHHDRENYHASLLAHPIASNCSLKQHLRKKPGRNGPLPHSRSTPRQSVCQSVSLSV
eukprot:CAMPEP_0171523196 /NCGR_PEP_ID=MMETSP0959-20130129/8254_1 /TAXON_ID=87120 /ORGANISM="Aurantiochytrium limacinum, Strain ATCCMYA-1381" /LENGTH=171 /DNA_ID=CAMNT_0012063583 /DNA_START=878 /DNA_END=1390 /DNA_ORIENTATION=+